VSAGPASPAGDGSVRRRGRIEAIHPDGLDVAWLQGACDGCVGCGGRCSLFAKGPGAVERLATGTAGLSAGMEVDVALPVARLRHAATAAYGVAVVALLAGAGLGHALGAAVGHGNAGALLGLLGGTFLAGRLTKRLAVAPHPVVRPCAVPNARPSIEIERP
jgi:positive regulator of sigma E activity